MAPNMATRNTSGETKKKVNVVYIGYNEAFIFL